MPTCGGKVPVRHFEELRRCLFSVFVLYPLCCVFILHFAAALVVHMTHHSIGCSHAGHLKGQQTRCSHVAATNLISLHTLSPAPSHSYCFLLLLLIKSDPVRSCDVCHVVISVYVCDLCVCVCVPHFQVTSSCSLMVPSSVMSTNISCGLATKKSALAQVTMPTSSQPKPFASVT